MKTENIITFGLVGYGVVLLGSLAVCPPVFLALVAVSAVGIMFADVIISA